MLRPLWLAAAAALLAGCPAEATPAYQVPPPAVSLGRVERGRLPASTTLWGTVATPPGLDVPVGSLESGYLSRLEVGQGDRVVRGQPLAEISAGPTRDQAEQAEAQLDSEQAKASEAKARAARTDELLRRGAASTREAQQARAAARMADAAVQAAQAAYDAARHHLARTLVRSPIEGTVVRLLAAPGESIASGGRAVVEVADTRVLELRATAGAAQASSLRAGAPAQLLFDELPGSGPIRSKVIAVAPAIDPATGTVTVRLSIPSPAPPGVRLGLYGSATVEEEETSEGLTVPAVAVQRLPASPQPFVLLVDGDRRVRRVTVELGPRGGDRIVVRGSGLAEGQRVVTGGGYALPDGTLVAVAP